LRATSVSLRAHRQPNLWNLRNLWIYLFAFGGPAIERLSDETKAITARLKTKFGDGLKSKSDVAGRNEVLCKVLCHNICCIISAVYELGIQPEFGLS
jgi:hypothetical protein